MRRVLHAVTWGVMAVSLAAGAQPAAGQGMLGRMKERAKERIEEKAGGTIDRAIDGQPQPAPAPPAAPGASSTAAAGAPAAAAVKPGEGAWANYDFVPGERVLFADDFSRDRVGNFPQRLEFRSGNMEVVEWQGRRWLRAEDGELLINLPETLPERFTLEFDLAGSGNAMEISFADQRRGSDPRLEIGTWFARLRSGAVDGQGELGVKTDATPVRIRISVDGGYLKLYANEKRALNVPNANLGRSRRVYLFLNGWSADQPRMIADVRIAAGGRALYDALSTEGRVTTQGILFASGSDRIQPESTPTLKEIGQMLTEHPELRIRIEGHTDDVGQAASNQTLSEQRAAAVRLHLIQSYGIDADRLEATGFGASRPTGSNDTQEGRQQNRRVELVKI